jgi:hypothetical protein
MTGGDVQLRLRLAWALALRDLRAALRSGLPYAVFGATFSRAGA